MAHMARKLAEAGFQVRKFNYSTTKQDLGYQAGKLYSFAQGAGGSLPHFVAHSMGGLITLQMLLDHPECASGRVVLMGSPIQGSRVARRVSRWPTGTSLLGQAEPTLAQGIQEWPDNREIGMIAGTRALGLGVLAGGATEHGDGTVLARESLHDGLKDHVEIPSSHTSMLFSAVAARQAIGFLQRGYFSH
jgi:pimeloyl-ACP methyl ester carboxylesterase